MTADVHQYNGIVKFHSSIQLPKPRQLSTVVLITASELSSDPTKVVNGSFTRSCSASRPKSMAPLRTLLPNWSCISHVSVNLASTEDDATPLSMALQQMVSVTSS